MGFWDDLKNANKKFITASHGGDEDTARIFIDPLNLGVSDALLGKRGGPPSYEDHDAKQDEILAKLEAGMPLEYEEEAWLEDYAPDLLGQAEALGPSAVSNIKEDEDLKRIRMEALSALEEQAETGFSPADFAQQVREQKALRQQTRGQLGAIEQNMASRGIGGSGLELMAQLGSAQASDSRAADMALEREARGYENRMRSRQAAGGMAGEMSRDDYQRERDAAMARDSIERYNVENRARREEYNNRLGNEAKAGNLQGRQTVASNNSRGRNNFGQQRYGNQAAAAQIRYNQNSERQNRSIQQYADQEDAYNRKREGVVNGAGSVFGAILSDERVKTDIEEIPEQEIEAFLQSIVPSSFSYKDGRSEGQHVGVMAQDIERTPIGKTIVDKRGPESIRSMDKDDLIGALLGSVSYLYRKQKERDSYGS